MNIPYRLMLATIAIACVFSVKASAQSSQQWVGSITIGRTAFMGSGPTFIAFGVPSGTALPAQTCSYWGVEFQFDTSTPQGKSWYAMLLTAKATGKPIDVWYENSSTPGKDQTNGCTYATISLVDAIGFSE